MAIDLNLEIIVDADLTILAYRHDPPEDMKWMVINAGHWQIVGKEKQRPELLLEVREMIIKSKYEICSN
jgi:hypothetical protein